MAKSKSASGGKAKPLGSSKSKTAAATNDRPAAPKGKSKAGDRAMTGVEIGHVAGEVWTILDRDGAQTLAAVKKAVDAPGDLVAAAVGWLAREDKVEFASSGRTVKLALRYH